MFCQAKNKGVGNKANETKHTKCRLFLANGGFCRGLIHRCGMAVEESSNYLKCLVPQKNQEIKMCDKTKILESIKFYSFRAEI